MEADGANLKINRNLNTFRAPVIRELGRAVFLLAAITRTGSVGEAHDTDVLSGEVGDVWRVYGAGKTLL